MDKLEKGRLGEDAVCTLLEQRGHEIIAWISASRRR